MTDLTSESLPRPQTNPFRWWMIAVFVVVVALMALVAFQMQRNGPLAAGPVGQGEVAPEFTLTTFEKTQWAGQSFSLADLRGKVVVVNFWASWCIPCEQEAAELENASRHYAGQEVLFLGVDYVDTETEALGYLQRFDITYPNGPDLKTAISHAFRIKGVPETYFIDQNGVLAYVKIGPFNSQAEIQNVVDDLLQK